MTMARRTCCLIGIAAALIAADASAERFLIDPATGPGDPAIDFSAFTLTPDGTQIIATAQLNAFATADDEAIYSLTIPSDFSSTITPVQLSTTSFLVGAYDSDGPAAVSPDGSTVLFTHDGRQREPAENTIHTMPITGESGNFNGLFSGLDSDPFSPAPNLVAPGNANFEPRYSPDGSTIFFINSEAGFGGAIPPWDTGSFGDFDFPSVWGNPDWDVLYSVPAAGGTPMPVTTAADGDLDEDLFTITPDGASVVYAPDNPIAGPFDRGDDRPTIYTVPASGGASTAIPMAAAPNPDFTISAQLEVTPDGQSVLFIGDYDTPGKNELYTVPITGGTPTKINDELHFAGDVRSFAISPDGASVAYAAGQTVGSVTELFLKDATGAGDSIRVSDAAPDSTGDFDVGTTTGRGTIAFSPDSQTIYYRGDLTQANAFDLYAVDTSEKDGTVPSSFTYIGPDGGDFLLASNWQDAEGNPLPADIAGLDNQDTVIASLLIDGDLIGGNREVSGSYLEQIQFGFGGSLEIINGAVVTLTSEDTIASLDFDPGSGLRIVDGTLITNDDILIDGTVHLEGAVLQSTGDDIEFQDEHDGAIINSQLIAQDNLIFENSLSTVVGSTFDVTDRLSLRYDSTLVVVDTDLNVDVDVEPVFTLSDGEGTSVTLAGVSTLTTDSISEGTDLILADQSFASLGSLDVDPASSTASPPSVMVGTNPLNELGEVGGDYASQIIFMSTEASLELRSDVLADPSGVIDVRDLIINGLTGLSYSEDPSAWNVTDWDGVSALALLQLVPDVSLAGDYNGDGIVDAADYTIWRDNLGTDEVLPNDTTPGSVDQGDYDVWVANFGATTPPGTVIPEPTALGLIVVGLSAAAGRRRGTACQAG